MDNDNKQYFIDDETLSPAALKRKHELEIIERLCAIGLKPDPLELARQFAFPLSETHSETQATQSQDDPKKNEI